MENKIGQWLEKVKRMKKDQWLIVVLVGVLLLVIAIPISPQESTEDKEGQATAATSTEADTENSSSQVGELEDRLKAVLEKVSGVGEVQVMITLKSSGEKVVEKDRSSEEKSTVEEDQEGGSTTSKEQSNGEETIYIQQEDGGQTPYIIEEIEPEIAGVVVVAQGGDNAVTAKNITEAVMALFGVEAHKIKIMKMN